MTLHVFTEEASFGKFAHHFFRNVDLIADAPDRLLRMIPELKSNKSLPKIAFATNVAPHMNTDTNTSVSFKHFVSAIRQLTS